MNNLDKQKQEQADEMLKPSGMETPYPASIEKMSERWREIQREGQQNQAQPPRNFVERNYLSLGIGIALLIIALLIVFGGFAFLVMRAH